MTEMDHKLTRRSFVGAGLAAIALPCVPAIGSAAIMDVGVFDRRFAEGLAFCRSMAARGVPVIGFAGDLTRVWLQHLDPLWCSRSVPVVGGLTTVQGLFCLEHLAWDRGLRVLRRTAMGAFERLAGGRSEPLVSWSIGSPGREHARSRQYPRAPWETA